MVKIQSCVVCIWAVLETYQEVVLPRLMQVGGVLGLLVALQPLKSFGQVPAVHVHERRLTGRLRALFDCGRVNYMLIPQ